MSSDIDYQLACIHQAEINDEESNQNKLSPQFPYSSSEDDTATRNECDKPLSLVDERWEMLDPTPDVRAMFIEFDNTFFKGRLAGVEVKWSPRMTLCAGVCSYEGRGGLCSIRLSTPLLKLRPRKDLVETLLHEMIHAYLFVTQNNKDRDGHGPEFCKHMNRINKEAGTKISIYHNFQDEVDLYRQHIWRCDGPCRTRKPFFGYVKRAMNRAPSPRDPWWSSHQQSCGGTYHKEKEPEGYGEKKGKRKREDVDSNASKKSKSRDINSVPAFEGEGKLLNGNSNPKVHPTLQEIWSKKKHIQDNDNNHTVTSLKARSNDLRSSSSGEEERATVTNGSLRNPGTVLGASRNVPTSSAGKYKPSNGRGSEDKLETGGNIHGFSGKVAAPTFHNFFKNPHGPTATSAKHVHDGKDIKENSFDKSMIRKGSNNSAKTGSNIHGFSGQVEAPTFHNFFKNPHGPTTTSGKYEIDGNNKEIENAKNGNSSRTNDLKFPGRGQVLGGKPKPTESGSKTVKKDDRLCIDQADPERAHVVGNRNGDGWLSKKSKTEDKPNKVVNKNDKHIKKSRKIVKLMEIVGSDSDSDSDVGTSVCKKSQSNFKSTEVKYISDSDEDEDAYNNKIYSQMQENEDLESDFDINIDKVSKTSHEVHTSSHLSTKSSNSKGEMRAPDDEKNHGAFYSSKNDKMPDADSGQLNVQNVTGMMVNCPVCGISVNESSINHHIDECLNYSFLNQ